MLPQRNSRLDPDRAGDHGRRRPERVRGGSSRPRRHRPGIECLEDRRLLAAITEFPLPAGTLQSDTLQSGLTAGPDGNLWFAEGTSAGNAIGRITPSGALTAFPLQAGSGAPGDLTIGPEGNLCFPEFVEIYTGSSPPTPTPTGVVAIGQITPAGGLTEFPLKAGDLPPGSLTVGPDGNLWLPGSYAICRITPSGALTEFPLQAGYSNPQSLTPGPDGNLWFTDAVASMFGAIGRITPSGAVTEFPLPAGYYDSLGALTVGLDGNLWFPESSTAGDAIGRITPAGALAEFPLPTTGLVPGSLTIGADGNLWFAEGSSAGSGAIGRITPSGALAEFPLPTDWTVGPDVPTLTAGPDGNLWFPEYETSGPTIALGRITPSGAFTEFPLPADHGFPRALTVGPDGNLWFTETSFFDGDAIGRIDLTGPRVTSVTAVAHSSKAIRSILIGFDGAMDPASAKVVRFYSVDPGVERGHKLVFRKGVKIRRVLYDVTAQTVRLKLAVPQKRPVRVTVRAGLVAADGMASTGDFTAVVE
jgi:streptogramin lyase